MNLTSSPMVFPNALQHWLLLLHDGSVYYCPNNQLINSALVTTIINAGLLDVRGKSHIPKTSSTLLRKKVCWCCQWLHSLFAAPACSASAWQVQCSQEPAAVVLCAPKEHEVAPNACAPTLLHTDNVSDSANYTSCCSVLICTFLFPSWDLMMLKRF